MIMSEAPSLHHNANTLTNKWGFLTITTLGWGNVTYLTNGTKYDPHEMRCTPGKNLKNEQKKQSPIGIQGAQHVQKFSLHTMFLLVGLLGCSCPSGRNRLGWSRTKEGDWCWRNATSRHRTDNEPTLILPYRATSSYTVIRSLGVV